MQDSTESKEEYVLEKLGFNIHGTGRQGDGFGLSPEHVLIIINYYSLNLKPVYKGVRTSLTQGPVIYKYYYIIFH